ncbi:hypothetical protein SFSGTM_05480 [Sulfuriferula nivalis]|uniref:Phospholipase C/D domain-containing protein n=2 Tax=Sulfuriferula nivalis TaxID=2675298 RepID=A0A809SGD6_9PROT|nr:hypothetical protein SFSGTM_05480 [Sulfuriferula nivalis]
MNLSYIRLNLSFMNKTLKYLIWSVPLLLQANDVYAWGLYTHVFFAQWLVWGVPLLDGELRRAVMRYPKLVMAGACLPDLALVGSAVRTSAFTNTHDWEPAQVMLNAARNDQERALAVGFYSHLFADVVAHHHFVPAHERLWMDCPVLTHTISEWMMDAHLSEHVLATPKQLLMDGSAEIVAFVAFHFSVPEQQAKSAVRLLARADHGLRWCRVPQFLYKNIMRWDKRVASRFDYFINVTNTRFAELNQVLAGASPMLAANGGCAKVTRQRINSYTPHEIQSGHPLPEDCFWS